MLKIKFIFDSTHEYKGRNTFVSLMFNVFTYLDEVGI